MPCALAGMLRLIHLSNCTCLSTLATLFYLLAALCRSCLWLNRRRNGELPLLTLGAAAGKRHTHLHHGSSSVSFLWETYTWGSATSHSEHDVSVFVLAQNEANPGPQPLSFNEASTVKLEFWAKTRPKTQDTSSFRLIYIIISH